MASAPHRECGMSIMAWGTASSQVVCNARTGETAAVDIPAAVQLLRMTHKLEFSLMMVGVIAVASMMMTKTPHSL